VDIPRERMADLLERAAAGGRWAELPVIPAKLDPQVYVSRNDAPEPFHLICEHDVLLGVFAGEGRVTFADAPVHHFLVSSGDLVYIPARTPHRMVPTSTVTQFRLKANPAGLEALAWFCETCGAEISRHEFDADKEIPQRVYLDACETFNAGDRRCAGCGTVQAELAVEQTHWAEIAEALSAAASEENA